jgi:TolB-like protein
MVVMPFANETGDPQKKFFSDGLARELRTILSRNPRLKVAAPTSSAAIAGEDDFAIGRKLGVGNILRGSVQRDNARIRVSAELIEIEGGLVRWAETYDRALADVFALQSEIAETVALSLVTQVAGDAEAKEAAAAQGEIGGTQNLAAYEAFLRGLALYDLGAGGDSNRSGLAQFEAAIAADPDYAAARRAIALENRLAQGHLALGFAFNNGQLKRALALNPALASVHFAMAIARLMQGDAAGAAALAGKERTPLFRLTATAVAAAKLGDAAAAAQALGQIVAEYGDAALYQQAQVTAQQRGQAAATLALLDRAFAAGDPGLLWAPRDPLLDPLRGEARFKDLLSRLGS